MRVTTKALRVSKPKRAAKPALPLDASLYQVMKARGVSRARELAPAVEWAVKMHTGFDTELSGQQLYRAYVNRYSDISLWLPLAEKYAQKRLLPRSLALAAIYICALQDWNASGDFFEAVVSGGAPRRSAVNVLSDVLNLRIQRKQAQTEYGRLYSQDRDKYKDLLGLIINTWNADRQGKRIRTIRALAWNPADPFPTAI